MEYTRTTYVQFSWHAGQLDELHTREDEVETRDLDGFDIPEGIFGFQFFDKIEAEIEVDGETVALVSEPINPSTMFYYGGIILNEEDVRQTETSATLDYMQRNGSQRMLKTEKGILMPFGQGYIRIKPKMVAC